MYKTKSAPKSGTVSPVEDLGSHEVPAKLLITKTQSKWQRHMRLLLASLGGRHVCQPGHHTNVLQDTAPRAGVMVKTAAA